MKSIKLAFTRAATGRSGPSTFLLLIWALFILDDAERREKQQREKRDRHAMPQRKPKAPGC